MLPSGLRISWAMPAAISPMARRRSLRSASSSSCLSSVMSCTMSTVPSCAPAGSCTGEADTRTLIRRPLAFFNSSSWIRLPFCDSFRRSTRVGKTGMRHRFFQRLVQALFRRQVQDCSCGLAEGGDGLVFIDHDDAAGQAFQNVVEIVFNFLLFLEIAFQLQIFLVPAPG